MGRFIISSSQLSSSRRRTSPRRRRQRSSRRLLTAFAFGSIVVCGINFWSASHPLAHEHHPETTPSVLLASFIHEHNANNNDNNNDDDDDESLLVPPLTPTHHACDKTRGLYHIAMTDILGGVGTALIQLVVGQLLYAKDHNLTPWIHLGNTSQVIYDPVVHGKGSAGAHLTAKVAQNASYVLPSRQHYRTRKDMIPGPPTNTTTAISMSLSSIDFHFPGTGIWNHYFLPVSDFVPGDRSCASKAYVTMDLYLITPGIHGYDDRYATRAWRYDYLPEYSTQPYKPLHEWLQPQRQKAHAVWHNTPIRLRPYLLQRAEQANPHCSTNSSTNNNYFCLGLHIRHSDKAAGRRQVPANEFLPYAQAFVQEGGHQIYLATDSTRVLQEIHSTWPIHIQDRIRTLSGARRSSNQTAVFDMVVDNNNNNNNNNNNKQEKDQHASHQQQSGKNHHATNQQALVEIAALSRCHLLVHGLSALSEASIWMNIDLHYRSVNLEEDQHLDSQQFAQLVQGTMQGKPVHELPTPPKTNTFYDKLVLKEDKPSKTAEDLSTNKDESCDEYTGVLHIAVTAKEAGPARAFFGSIVHQLYFAKQHLLRPWIHLAPPPLASPIVYDTHNHQNINVTVKAASYSRPQTDATGRFVVTPPFPPNPHAFVIPGSNVWKTYFENVDNIANFPQSCTNKPIFFLSPDQVTNALEQTAPSAESKKETAKLVAKYLLVKEPIMNRVKEVNILSEKEICLAVHIEITGQRKKGGSVSSGSYIPYMEEFASITRQAGVIYITADSTRALKYINNTASSQVNSMIRTQGEYVVLSKSKTIPPYVLDDHHRVNSEALVDIFAMSQCQFLLHRGSFAADAVILLNLDLHTQSINLGDSHKKSTKEFATMVKSLFNHW